MAAPKLCIVTDAWLPQVNGVVTTLVNIVDQAKKEGWDVLVIHPYMFKVGMQAPNYKEIRLTIPFGLKKKIEKFNPDYLHIATEGPLGLSARIGFRREVYTTAYHTQWPEFLKDIIKIPTFITLKYLKWFHSHGAVMVATKSIAQYLKEKNISNNVKYLTRGVNLDLLTPNLEIEKDSRPLLLSVGRVSKEKNLEVFCNLDHKKYKLILIGDGPILNELKLKYPGVIFTGMLKGSELANYYASADCLVFTSKKDTFGLVMIEAMKFGTPIAGYPVPGPIDIVTDDCGAISDDIEKAILKALTVDRDKCKKTSSIYTWKQTWNEFKDNLVDYTI